ncbi:hypothetical protein CapIbe_011547 [Capra ibex]
MRSSRTGRVNDAAVYWYECSRQTPPCAWIKGFQQGAGTVPSPSEHLLVQMGKLRKPPLETARYSERPMIPPRFPVRKEASGCPLVAGSVVQTP